jgi:hypothetical protein
LLKDDLSNIQKPGVFPPYPAPYLPNFLVTFGDYIKI